MLIENKKQWDTIVIGAGQAGLAIGYYLKKFNKDFIILDAADKIGDSWRNRWDSLKLFTPNWANALPGHKFPPEDNKYPTKDEVADFLIAYARLFELPVENNVRVTQLSRHGAGYQLETNIGALMCSNVVVANGSYARPRFPVFSNKLSKDIFQIHAADYKRVSQLPAGDVLVVGAGTSGVQIAVDIAGKRKTYISGVPPFKIPEFVLKYFGRQAIWAMNNIMTIKTKPGRNAAHSIKVQGTAAPLVNISLKDAERLGATSVSKIIGVRDGLPVLADDTQLKVSAVIWCTGHTTDFSWIKIENVADSKGYPFGDRGVSIVHQGLYFVGMTFQYALTSSWIKGVGRDAKYVAEHLCRNRGKDNHDSFLKSSAARKVSEVNS